MITKIIKEKLVDVYSNTPEIAIAHGCNCYTIWNTKISSKLKNIAPQAYVADCNTIPGARLKIGTFTIAEIGKKKVFNLYVIFDYRNTKLSKIDYNATATAFKNMNDYCIVNNIKVVYVSKLFSDSLNDWDRIATIINQNTPDINIIVTKS